MSASAIDPERIAALIDGRLDAGQRAALLSELEASPEAFEVYTDAVAALREGEAGGATGSRDDVIAIESRRLTRPFRINARIMALAAVLLIAVALPLVRRGRGMGLLGDPESIVAMLNAGNATSATWQNTPWSEMRGASDALPPRARAIRIGARIADLELLLRSRDTAATQVALQIAALLDGIPAGSIAAAEYRALAAGAPGARTNDALRRASSFAEQVAGATEVRAGAWLEAARVAASERDSSYFRSTSVGEFDRALTSLRELPPAASASRARVTQLLAASPRDWPEIGKALDELLREMASG